MRHWVLLLFLGSVSGEVLQNGGFESGPDHWNCWDQHCATVDDKVSGLHGLKVTDRKNTWNGPMQFIQVSGGKLYRVSGHVILLNDHAGHLEGERVQLEIAFKFRDSSDVVYVAAAERYFLTAADGWVQVVGDFSVPSNREIEWTRFYYQGPDPSVDFVCDDASITELTVTYSGGGHWRDHTDNVLQTKRKSDIHLHVTKSGNIREEDVQIQVLQTKKAFPFGTAVSADTYNDHRYSKYADFIHKHFNWAGAENALKWNHVEPQEGHANYKPALDMAHGLRSHGIKVRGHNLVWSVKSHVQGWVRALSGDRLRDAVKHHINDIMHATHGLLEHWDVNNENLHGEWFQAQLGDPDYDLELFRIAHHADPNVKLFLNDFSVVASGASTTRYLEQTRRFKSANVGLYGIGVQCHFPDELEPNPDIIKHRLDVLAQAGVPIWVTELDVMSKNETTRADFYEKALRALYGHPAVEGILFWGFWDKRHWRGEAGSLVTGDNLQLTPAGRRVLDLLENQWMTDETHVLSQSSDQFTVRGFHGDYEVRVRYQGRELHNLRKTFTLGKGGQTVNVSVHV